jgi:Arc/MetJ-type ribon-helix-helix transcriptional regulator
MSTVKIAITIESDVLSRVDALVTHGSFPSRSRAIQVAVAEKLARVEGTRLAAECARLDRREEQALADEVLGVGGDAWPEY